VVSTARNACDAVSVAAILPSVMRDQRGLAFAAAVDAAIDIDTWLACPLAVEHAPDVVLWELARQFDVAGPLIQAMRTRSQKERLLKNALLLQKKRGTSWSVEELMRLLGYTDAKVLDRVAMERLNYNAEVEAGERAMPTLDELLAELLELVWPTPEGDLQ